MRATTLNFQAVTIMSLIVYNTLTRQKETFQPINPNQVRLYCCGPTVYDHSHIGHAKLYVGVDIIVRYLRAIGYQVRYVQNITDVGHILDTGEDRILKGAARERIEPMEVVERYMRSYLDDMDTLKNVRPNIMPRAAAHVPEQIAAIQALIEKGFAYVVNGSVYFDVSSAADYGKLSNRRLENAHTEKSRVVHRGEKRHPEDFALWKDASPEHILQWQSPWGAGYPGWHIECSAMALKYLGETFDIHGGGIDNLFPHNECEVAQSEALTGKPFANYWMHIGSLTVDGVKMSKSLGNFLTIKDALRQYTPEVLRLFILSSHYRGTLDYAADSLGAAQKAWERLVIPVSSLQQQLAKPTTEAAASDSIDPAVQTAVDSARHAFHAAMSDDFNTPIALAVLFDYTRQVNSLLNGAKSLSATECQALLAVYTDLAGDVFGILPSSGNNHIDALQPDRVSGLVELLLDLRTAARARRDYATSDQIRDQLQTLGITLEDGRNGTVWHLK